MFQGTDCCLSLVSKSESPICEHSKALLSEYGPHLPRCYHFVNQELRKSCADCVYHTACAAYCISLVQDSRGDVRPEVYILYFPCAVPTAKSI